MRFGLGSDLGIPKINPNHLPTLTTFPLLPHPTKRGQQRCHDPVQGSCVRPDCPSEQSYVAPATAASSATHSRSLERSHSFYSPRDG